MIPHILLNVKRNVSQTEQKVLDNNLVATYNCRIRNKKTMIQRKEEQTITPTDRLNIICFAMLIVISAACIVIAKKMKLPCWKFRIGWILFMDLIGVFLLILRLSA